MPVPGLVITVMFRTCAPGFASAAGPGTRAAAGLALAAGLMAYIVSAVSLGDRCIRVMRFMAQAAIGAVLSFAAVMALAA